MVDLNTYKKRTYAALFNAPEQPEGPLIHHTPGLDKGCSLAGMIVSTMRSPQAMRSPSQGL
jgi:hypothetical protein